MPPEESTSLRPTLSQRARDTQDLYTFTSEGYGNLVSEFDGTDSRYHQYDGLGSTEALIDDDTTVTDRYKYRAFGALESRTGKDRGVG